MQSGTLRLVGLAEPRVAARLDLAAQVPQVGAPRRGHLVVGLLAELCPDPPGVLVEDQRHQDGEHREPRPERIKAGPGGVARDLAACDQERRQPRSGREWTRGSSTESGTGPGRTSGRLCPRPGGLLVVASGGGARWGDDDRKRHSPPPVTARRLVPVRIGLDVITGDQLPRPRVGDLAAYTLAFSAATEHTDPDDPTLTTVAARLEVLHERPRPQLIATPPPRRERWRSMLHAPGWSAGWTSYLPPPASTDADGAVTLVGHVDADFGSQCRGWLRGRIARLWAIRSRHDTTPVPGDPATWGPTWGSTELTAVDVQPTATQGWPWPALPPGMLYTGLLAELDLDDVPDGRTGGVIVR